MPDLGPIHHLAYVVEEIEPVVQRLNEQFGAGPFLRIENVPVEDVTSRGEPAEFVHDAAFGICNGLPVELLQVASIEPAEVAARFRTNDGTPRLQHVAYALPPAAFEELRADLDAKELPEYLRARFGEDAEMTYHDASRSIGYDLEIHADSEGLRGSFTLLRQAAEGWDGSDLLRPFG
jgi:methylmalonyl-CoA/ethylmalonyl-CoA epimerase